MRPHADHTAAEIWIRNHQPGPCSILLRRPIGIFPMTIYRRTRLTGQRGWAMCPADEYGIARYAGEMALKVRDAAVAKVELAFRLRKVVAGVGCDAGVGVWPMPLGSVAISTTAYRPRVCAAAAGG